MIKRVGAGGENKVWGPVSWPWHLCSGGAETGGGLERREMP